MRAAQAEIDQQLAGSGQHHARGLGRDQRLEMQNIDEPRLDQLGLGSGAVTRRIGSSAKNTVPSGIACTSPVKRSSARWSSNSFPKRPVRASQSICFGRETQAFEEIERLFESGGHQKPAPGRKLADEEFEYRRLRLAMIQVRLDHVELIEIGEQRRRGIIHSAPLVQPDLTMP